MIRRHAQTGRIWLVLFFVLPIAALVSAIHNYKVRTAKNVLWIFTVFYGFTFVISNNQLDSNRYKDEIITLSSTSVSSFTQFTSLLYSSDTQYVDVLQPLLTFLVSRITSDYRILFAVFGLIFGYFYSRNIWYLLNFVEGRMKREAIPYIILFSMVITIWHINGFRFWTAAQVFVFGFFVMYIDGKKIKGILICLTSMLIHFSFVFPIVLLLIHLLIGNRLLILFLLCFVSFFISKISPDSFKEYTSILPESFQERTNKYVSEEYLERQEKEKKKEINWYVTGRVLALQYASNILLIIVFFKYRKEIGESQLLARLLCFGLLLASCVNVFGALPSIGRFGTVNYMFLFAALFLFILSYPRRVFYWWANLMLICTTILYVVVEIRRGFDTIGVVTIIGNPILAPFVENELPLIELVK